MHAEPEVPNEEIAHGDNTPPGFREWEEEGVKVLMDLRRSEGRTTRLQWAIGDWYCRGEATYGEAAAQGVPESGYARKTVLNCARVARRIPEHRRREELTYAHHDAVASLEEDAQDRWLTWAIEHEATVQELRDAIRAERDAGDPKSPGSTGPEDARLEVEDDDGACRVYEVRLDMDTGEDDRVHVATMHAVGRDDGRTAAWYADLLVGAFKKAKQ
jgi:hypothetical protein